MAEFKGQRGVWVTYEFGEYHEEPLTVSDSEREVILSARDHDTHAIKIAFWPFGMKFADAIEKWKQEKDD